MQKENLHDAPDLFDKRDSAAKTCFQLSRCTLLSLVFPKCMFKYCENTSNMAKCEKYCASNCLLWGAPGFWLWSQIQFQFYMNICRTKLYIWTILICHQKLWQNHKVIVVMQEMVCPEGSSQLSKLVSNWSHSTESVTKRGNRPIPH